MAESIYLFPNSVNKNTQKKKEREQNLALRNVAKMHCRDMQWEIWGWLNKSTKQYFAACRYDFLFHKYMKFVFSAKHILAMSFTQALKGYTSINVEDRSLIVGTALDLLFQYIPTDKMIKFVRFGTPGKYYKIVHAWKIKHGWKTFETLHEYALKHNKANHIYDDNAMRRWVYVYEIKNLLYEICEQIYREPQVLGVTPAKLSFNAIVNSIIYVSWRCQKIENIRYADYGKILA